MLQQQVKQLKTATVTDSSCCKDDKHSTNLSETTVNNTQVTLVDVSRQSSDYSKQLVQMSSDQQLQNFWNRRQENTII